MASESRKIRALVTGASSGIGEAIARSLAARGVSLVLVARRERELAALAAWATRSFGVEAEAIALDLGAPGAIAELERTLIEKGLEIDALINNAGFGVHGNFVSIPWEKHLAEIHLNVVVLTELTSRLVPSMVARGHGYVMNIASTAAFVPAPNYASYAATKAYVLSFTDALAYELRASNVSVTCFCPGATHSEFTAVAGHEVKGVLTKFFMSSERCAELAVDAMLARRRVVVAGALNSFGTWALRFLPRRLSVALAARFLG